MLDQRGLVVIGDVVGLGKTMVGSAVAASQPGSTLVICPKNLVAMWEGYFHRFDIPGRVMSISTARRDLPEMRHYGTVIIDESHRLRNKGTKSWDAVKEYIDRGNSKVILMTATMYNAYYSDIAGQLALKLDFDESLGLRPESLIEEIGAVELAKKTGGQLDTLRAFSKSEHNEDWQQLLGIFLIRRTRKFVEENFGVWNNNRSCYEMEYPDGSKYRFPKRVPKPLPYHGGPDDPGDKLASPENFDAMAELTYARYRLGSYLRSSVPQLEGDDALLIEDLKRSVNSYSGFIRTTALKRLTSSAQAFLMTLDRMLLRSHVLAHALEEGLALPVGTLSNSAYELGDEGLSDDEDFQEIEDGEAQTSSLISGYAGSVRSAAEWKQVAASTYQHLELKRPLGLRWAEPSWFEAESLLSAVQSDIHVMQAIITEHGNWDPASDSKLAALADFLNARELGQKVLVFSEYKDTIDYIFSHLPAMVPGRVIDTVTGQSNQPGQIARRFAPVANQALGGLPAGESEIEILLATDVLSEGQNLQDADTVINWDLPWTIIPMIQRAGRVDRIGQSAPEISVLSFRPQEGVENVLKLYKRLGNRLRDNAEIFGAGDTFFDDDGVVDQDFIAALFNGTANLELDEGDVDYPSFALGIWNAASEADKATVLSMQDARYSTMLENPLHTLGTMAYCVTHRGYNVIVSQLGERLIHLSPLAALRATSVSPNVGALPRRSEFFAELQSGLEYAFGDSRDKHFLALNKGLRKRFYEALVHARDSLADEKSLRSGIEQMVEALVVSPLMDSAQHAVLAILKATKNLSNGVEGIDQLLDLHRDDQLFKKLVDSENDLRLVCAMGFVNP
jgi:superfamily II DNA or RNA helicase